MNTKEILDKIELRESFLLAFDGQYLGRLSLNSYDIESISNPYGNYGSKYSTTSIYNKYGNYGSAYASFSPFNSFSTTPPIIYLRGVKYGFLSKNNLLNGIVLDPDDIAIWLMKNYLT